MAQRVEHNRFSRQSVDLASQRIGGQVLSCTDDFFAEMENLIKPGRGVFIEDKYTDRGKWMDGWESRRRRFREDGTCVDGFDHDWCVIRLGVPGIIFGVNADTHHFLGNAPQAVSLEACYSHSEPGPNTHWREILPKTPVQPGMENLLDIEASQPETGWTHVRFHIYPDGGVARLRVYGEVVRDQRLTHPGELIDLASIKNGAMPMACSDMFFSDMQNLIMPGRGVNMGDGWETRRRRPTGNPSQDRPTDWLLLQLAGRGQIHKVVLDTCHYKGNYPESFHLEGVCLSLQASKELQEHPAGEPLPELPWQLIIPRTPLYPDREQVFLEDIESTDQAFTHVRLHIYPDGGVSRMRLLGFLTHAEAMDHP